MTTTSIEWTTGPDGTPGRSWNPTTGCTKVSDGCQNCYADSIATRFAGTVSWPNGFEPTLRPDRLEAPLHWRHPRRVFVDSASDLFHDAFPDEYIARVFAVMAAAQRHTFLLLTKRHGRMRSLLRSWTLRDEVQRHAPGYAREHAPRRQGDDAVGAVARIVDSYWPLPNVHLGVSVENQHWADIRIPVLLDTPAAVRWISAEPLLGPIELAGRGWLPTSPADSEPDAECARCGTSEFSDVRGHPEVHYCTGFCSDQCIDEGEESGEHCDGPIIRRSRLSWIVTGGESGRGARPCDLEWIRSLRDQCAASGTAFYAKQLGSRWAASAGLGQRKAVEPEHWPEDLRVREYPQAVTA